MASRDDYGKMIAAFFSGAAPAFGGSMLEKKRFKRGQEAAEATEASRRKWEEEMFGKRVKAETGAAQERRGFEAGEAQKQREFLGQQAWEKQTQEMEKAGRQATEAFQLRQEETARTNRIIEGYIYATNPQAVVTKPTGELDYEATVRNLTPDEYKDLLYIQARGVPAEPTRQWPRPEVDELLSGVNVIQSVIPYASPEQQKRLQEMLGPMLEQLAELMGIALPEKEEKPTEKPMGIFAPEAGPARRGLLDYILGQHLPGWTSGRKEWDWENPWAYLDWGSGKKTPLLPGQKEK